MGLARHLGHGHGHGVRHAVRIADDEVLERERGRGPVGPVRLVLVVGVAFQLLAAACLVGGCSVGGAGRLLGCGLLDGRLDDGGLTRRRMPAIACGRSRCRTGRRRRGGRCACCRSASRRSRGGRVGSGRFRRDVHLDEHRERRAVQIHERLLDEVDVVPLDPGLDEIVVGREHEEILAHRLGLQPREEGVDLRRVYVVVAFDLVAHCAPDLLELFAFHGIPLVRRFHLR